MGHNLYSLHGLTWIENINLTDFYYPETTFMGVPRRKPCIFFSVVVRILSLASLLIQAVWGVMIQFFAVNKGLESGGGSVDRTSSAAPAN